MSVNGVAISNFNINNTRYEQCYMKKNDEVEKIKA